MIRLEPIIDTSCQWAHKLGAWPWHVIGVFPSVDDVAADPFATHRGFSYTVGLGPFEVWCPQASIEDRGLGFEFLAVIVNAIAFATLDATLRPGDEALLALGIPGPDGEWERDADAVFWVGRIEPSGRRQTYQSPADQTLPVLWSSPLGWKEA